MGAGPSAEALGLAEVVLLLSPGPLSTPAESTPWKVLTWKSERDSRGFVFFTASGRRQAPSAYTRADRVQG